MGRGQGSGTPLKNHNTIEIISEYDQEKTQFKTADNPMAPLEFSSNTGPDPLKITKLPSQHSKLGHHWHSSETPLNGGPIMTLLLWHLDPSSLHQLKQKRKKKKTFFKSWTPLTKLSESAHEKNMFSDGRLVSYK